MVDYVSIVIATISLVGTLITSIIAAWTSYYRDERQRIRDTDAIRSKYSDPLLLAAQDLQAKLRNFAREHGIANWITDQSVDRREYMLLHTCFTVGQYLAWVHILRSEVQFLRFTTDRDNRVLTRILGQIRQALRQDSGRTNYVPCVLFAGEQQAIGELMTKKDDNGHRVCMGYGEFYSRYKEDAGFRKWWNRFIDDLVVVAKAKVQGDVAAYPDQRLRKLQHLMIDLVRELDQKGLRYQEEYLTPVPAAANCPCIGCTRDAQSQTAEKRHIHEDSPYPDHRHRQTTDNYYV
ncbi:hypothetical protein JAAARDRAFT_63572 [Jaapia argillacea MUCL 33604]|uniref:Uncharacterized protein n=1 Tax=Jaapia argillacea MUCL 33604 TaxID=933084 RepID=A0A067PFB0_9AGAM|nr:hypothetical protein JAAARDRAFT_63572 [Jaapia argillacea MUCL 33604]